VTTADVGDNAVLVFSFLIGLNETSYLPSIVAVNALSAPPILLVDGSAYLYRAFYALPELTTSKGQPTAVVKGVSSMLQRLRHDYPDSPMAVIFDAKGKTFRSEIYPEYKAHRPPMPDGLRAQIEPLHQLATTMGLPPVIVEGVEADDVIGTLAAEAVAAGRQVLISTTDKDMTQLVDENVTLVDTMKNTIVDAAAVEKKFGVPPTLIVDYLALMGDSSDNIPGIKGIGPKAATALLQGLGDLDAIYANLEKAADLPVRGASSLPDKLQKGRENAYLSQDLATIRRDIKLDLDIASLGVPQADRKALLALYDELEFRVLADDLRKAMDLPTKEATAEELAAQYDAEMARKSSSPKQSGQRRAAAGEEAVAAAKQPKKSAEEAADSLAAKSEPAQTGAKLREPEPGTQGQLHTLAESIADRNARGETSREAASAPSPQPGSSAEIRTETVLSEEALQRWLEKIREAGEFVVDVESTSLDALHARAVGIALAVLPGEGAYIPFGHDYPGMAEQLPEKTVLDALKPLLEDPDLPKVGQNLKYDCNVLANHGITLRGIAWDTMLESYVLEAGAERHSLDALAKRHLHYRTTRFKEVVGSGADNTNFSQVPFEQATPYAVEDAEVSLRLHQHFRARLEKEPALEALLRDIEMPLVPVLARMERSGVLVDTDALAVLSSELGVQAQSFQKQAWEITGHEFNLDSPSQIANILYEKDSTPILEGLTKPRPKMPILRQTPGGQPSTAESVLQELADLGHELPAVIMQYRSVSKLKSTYADALPVQKNPSTGRVHTSWHQAVVATGRLSSSDPNLQNIPIRTPEGRRIRQAFIAPEGSCLLVADYSQIELRLMAHLSGDERLLSAFAEGQDIHRATAAEVFDLPPEKVGDEERRRAKAINFGLIYGMSAFGLARQLKIEQRAARDYMERYFNRYAGVQRYMKKAKEGAAERGYVETLFGRRLILRNIYSDNHARRRGAERVAINAPLQGTAADIMKRAMIAVDTWLEQSGAPARSIMQVHDELVLEVKQESLEEVRAAVVKYMADAAELKIPLVVDIGSGANWDDAR